MQQAAAKPLGDEAPFATGSVAEQAPAPSAAGLMPLADVPVQAWHSLGARAIEPNGYYLPDWARAVDATARGRTGLCALAASRSDKHNDSHALIGLIPVITARRALGLPLKALVSAEAYGTLGTPLIAADGADEAVAKLMTQAHDAGYRALVLRDIPLDGPVARSFTRVLGWNDLAPRIVGAYDRAVLHTNADDDELLREALGAKKLKELRRQRNRLADVGTLRFSVAQTPPDVRDALEGFLKLEASGWKGRNSTALASNEGDATFVRRGCVALAATGQCEIVTLDAGDVPVASGIVLRQRDRAFFFKIAVNETLGKFSPGVQLTLDLTRHLCADPAITLADSTAAPDHPMIGPLWRGRMRMGDMIIPLAPRDPVFVAISTALRLRHGLRESLRPLVRFIRSIKD
jgi:CelD/BcsL family acetyltransferase involved in cellulose biosynthesis